MGFGLWRNNDMPIDPFHTIEGEVFLVVKPISEQFSDSIITYHLPSVLLKLMIRPFLSHNQQDLVNVPWLELEGQTSGVSCTPEVSYGVSDPCLPSVREYFYASMPLNSLQNHCAIIHLNKNLR